MIYLLNMIDLIDIFSLIALFFSVVLHEIAHGSVAYSLGDPTAKYEGRLTLNPLKHIDPFGSVILPLLLFIANSPILVGWAKPVPVNPYNFRDQKWGQLKVAIAGPATNFGIAIIFGLILKITGTDSIFGGFLATVVFLNLLLGLFNLLPIPPLDGSWVLFRLLPDSFSQLKYFMTQYGMFILILFLLFGGTNLLGFLAENILNFIF